MSDRPSTDTFRRSARPTPRPLDLELGRAEGPVQSALTLAIRRAYEHDWRGFASWCAARAPQAMPARGRPRHWRGG